MNSGAITSDAAFNYQNTGAASGSYILQAKVSYSGSDNFAIRYVITGLSVANMYCV